MSELLLLLFENWREERKLKELLLLLLLFGDFVVGIVIYRDERVVMGIVKNTQKTRASIEEREIVCDDFSKRRKMGKEQAVVVNSDWS